MRVLAARDNGSTRPPHERATAWSGMSTRKEVMETDGEERARHKWARLVSSTVLTASSSSSRPLTLREPSLNLPIQAFV